MTIDSWYVTEWHNYNARIDFSNSSKDEYVVHCSLPLRTSSITFIVSSLRNSPVFVEMETADAVSTGMNKADADRMLRSLYVVHNGIYEMDQDLDWLVQTSSNLASIHKEGNEVKVTTSQRSSIVAARDNMCAIVRAAFEMGGARTDTNEGYPGWKLNPDSELLKVAVESYERVFGKSPKILAIHAGLECGLFSEKYPEIDMISFGPTLRGVHSPDECLLIPTVQMVWDHLLDLLKNIK